MQSSCSHIAAALRRRGDRNSPTRCYAWRIDVSPGLARFSELVTRDDFPLDQAALQIGAWEYPERDIERYRDRLDDIAERCVDDVRNAAGGIGRARAISDWLFDRLGFAG